MSAQQWPAVAAMLSRELPASRVTAGASLGAFSTYRVGGPAGVLVEVADRADLARLAAVTARERWQVLVVGLGSNLLVSDSGFDGVALRLGEAFAACRIEGPRVTAGGAMALPVLARRCAAAGLGGFSWAVGVPGSVGGAVRMNAGGHGSDMAESLRRVEQVDLSTGESTAVAAADLQLGYRTSVLRNSHVVVEVELALYHSSSETEERQIREIVTWRRLNQPGGANTGSVFVNPPGDAAGRLVDAAGCKGLRRGSAAVSERHANFIVVDPGGSAADVVALMAEVAQRVRRASGVELQHETRLVGFDGTERSAP